MADAQESIQSKIQIARRDAEALKDRIKRKKDELADTTRELSPMSVRVVDGLSYGNVMQWLTNDLQSAMSRDNAQNSCHAWR